MPSREENQSHDNFQNPDWTFDVGECAEQGILIENMQPQAEPQPDCVLYLQCWWYGMVPNSSD